MNTNIIELLNSGEIDKAIEVLNNSKLIDVDKDVIRLYEVEHHAINDAGKRPDKAIYRTDPDITRGERGQLDKIIPVARLCLPFQKKIVRSAVNFLGTPELIAEPATETQQRTFELIKKLHKDNKLSYLFKKIMRKTLSECECAELWYFAEDEKYWKDNSMITPSQPLRPKVKILSPLEGDQLFPYFNADDDLITFGHAYEVKDEEGNEVAYFNVYTAEFIYLYRKDADTWNLITTDGAPAESPIKNELGKIPVIYYHQEQPDWHDVQSLIDRLETKFSNLADTNDYFDSPIIVAKGNIRGFAQKGEQGKLLEADQGADVSYLTWNDAPESLKFEAESLTAFVHNFTQTPDISFESVKGLGQFSGIALKMLFIDAHMKAADKEDLFGQGVQRRINLLTAMLKYIDSSIDATVTIEPEFNYFMPRDLMEEIRILKEATDSGLMSKETAIKQNPLLMDGDSEIERIQAEAAEAVNALPIPNTNLSDQ